MEGLIKLDKLCRGEHWTDSPQGIIDHWNEIVGPSLFGFNVTGVDPSLSYSVITTAGIAEWNFGDANTQTSNTPSHTYTDGLGSHKVTLTGGVDDTAVTRVNLYSNASITSLEGVDRFINLERLRLYLTGITILPDLSPLTKLFDLQVQNNTISALDPTPFPAMLVLYLNDTNVTALDLSNNPLLIILNAYNCKLTVSEIDQAFLDMDANAVSNCVIRFEGQTPSAPPTATSATARANLVARGCTITTD